MSLSQSQNPGGESKQGNDSCIAALQSIQLSPQVRIHVVLKKSVSKLEYVPILLLWLKYLPILPAEFLFLSGTYFAQNSAGKIYQGLPTTQLCSLQPLNYPGRDSLHNFTQQMVC